MNGLEIAVSDDVLNGLFLILLYSTIGGFAFRWLIPRLSPNAKMLAAVMLATQILVICLSQIVETNSSFEALLWELRHEWNIPSTLAFTQLATVSAVFILVGWLARSKPTSQRIYYVVLGLLFLFLSIDEYFKVHEPIKNWYLIYAAVGGIVALITLAVAARSATSVRIWLACLMSGLAVGAMGAILFELINRSCDTVAFLQVSGCFHFFVWEEASELLGIWVALVAALGLFSELPPSRRMHRFLLCLPLLCLLLLFLNAMLPRLEQRLLARAASVEFSNGMRLIAYRFAEGSLHTDRLPVQIYLSSRQEDILYQGFSVHLVDQSTGKSVASNNVWMDRQHGIWLFGPEYEQVYRQMLAVSIPPGTPANHALWVVLTIWTPGGGDEYRLHKVLSSDQRLLSKTQVVLGEIVLQEAEDAAPQAKPLAQFANGFALESVNLPGRARPGGLLDITMAWRSHTDGAADYIQFLHLIHEERNEWWGYDQPPLGQRLPTRLWYDGLADSEQWQVPLPADLSTGNYTVFSGLYLASDAERITATDENGAPFLDAYIPIGSLYIESA